jgi:hypothetical protein
VDPTRGNFKDRGVGVRPLHAAAVDYAAGALSVREAVALKRQRVEMEKKLHGR